MKASLTERAVVRTLQNRRCRLPRSIGTIHPIHRYLVTTTRPRLARASTQDFDLNRLNTKRREYEQNRTAFLAAGAVAGILSFIYTAWKLKVRIVEQREKTASENQASSDNGSGNGGVRLDSPQTFPSETFKTEAGEKRKIVMHDDQGREIVPTGNGVVPIFPRIMDVRLPSAKSAVGGESIAGTINQDEGTEFTLVGLGMRTVTFFGIQVYLVGFYVATQDVAKLQSYLTKKINPLATTLIPSEKDALRKSLRDPVQGTETWDTILRDAGCRSLFRISPVKDTDFHHLRDGFIRAISARSQVNKKEYADEEFGVAIKEFKGFFNRGTVPKKKEIVLCRDESGKMSVMYGDEGGDEENKMSRREILGTIGDERISRLLWLNYLAGKNVASEGARENIIEGVMEFVERPVGTVATQVV